MNRTPLPIDAAGDFKVALVGLGYWGPKLLRNLVSLLGVSNVVAVDRSMERIAAAAAEHPSVRFEQSLDAALADESIRAFVIATPVPTHAPLARQVLEAGRHVLVEKPLANSAAAGAELVQLAEANDLVLMVGHTFLFSPRVEAIAERIAAGHLGRIDYAASSRLNLGLYQDAHVIWDLAPHDFSILFHLLGEEPASVQTTTRCARRPLLPDVAFVNLTFESGAIATVHVSWLAPRKVRNLVLVGERSMIVYDDLNADEPVKLVDRGIVVQEGADFAANAMTYRYGDTLSPHVSADEPLARELLHFVQCIRDGVPCRSDGRFGLQVVRALEAADLSWQWGGLPVDLDAVPGAELTGPRVIDLSTPVDVEAPEGSNR